MSYGTPERVKQLGHFSYDGGSTTISMIFEERQVYIGSDMVKFLLPAAIQFVDNGARFRIKAGDLRGFMGLLGGHVEEFHRERDIIMRRLEKLGVKVEELP
jgi:hypothetical protein